MSLGQDDSFRKLFDMHANFIRALQIRMEEVERKIFTLQIMQEQLSVQQVKNEVKKS